MNSFEQQDNFAEQIAQIIETLNIIKENGCIKSEIDKAVVLESLRNAYVSILKCKIAEENITSAAEIAKKEQEERERREREEQQRREQEEHERREREEQQRREQEERERREREEQQRREQEERERREREEQQRREQEERERREREEQQRRDQEERERREREEQQRREQEERERREREEQQRREQEERERREREEQQRREQEERERREREEQQRREQEEQLTQDKQKELFDIFTPISEAGKNTETTLFKQDSTKQQPKPEKRSLNDLLQEKNPEKPSLYSKIQESKIEDLAKAISLADKFLFIKELFKNQGEDFSKAIKLLNQCPNLEAAFAELEKMKKYYFWDTVSPAYLTFCDLVRRRFL